MGNMFYSIEFLGVAVSSLIAIIALFYSKCANQISEKALQSSEKANKLSEKANELSKEAMEESEKENFPLVKFVGNIQTKNKDYDILGNEVTFDLNSVIFDTETIESDKIPCISVTLENIGNGILTGIEIEKIFICNKNRLMIDYRNSYFLDEENTTLFSEEYEKENKQFQDFVLCKGEKIEINLFIARTEKMKDWEELDFNLAGEEIEEFFEENRNITVAMYINLLSINKSRYKQEWITGNFYDGKCMFNSFYNAEKYS